MTSASAKIHTGPPTNVDKDDWEDMGLRNRVWAGIIPVYETLGEPITLDFRLVKTLTPAVREYIDARNGKEKA